MSGQSITPSEQLNRTRLQTTPHQATQQLFWRQQNNKRGAPTPVGSTSHTPAEPAQDVEMEGADHNATASGSSLIQPFTIQPDAALEVTLAAMGVDPQDHNAVQEWLTKPVQSNREMFDCMRAYHEQVIRPELYSMVVQLETGLKTLNNSIFQVRREVSWMAADNRLLQKHACGVQLLTTGWPQGFSPAQRVYQIGWMLQNTPKVAAFLHERGQISDHYAHEQPRYLNALSTEPVTVPAGGDFWSTMTLLTFKAYDLRSAVLEKFGGGTGCPLYSDERTQVKGYHIKVAPCSPQWQRKLESPLRVLLACVNAHPDHNSSRLTILWKTLTLLEPLSPGEDFKEDIVAWARLYYFDDEGEFKGRLEVTRDLEKVLMSPPSETTTLEDTLWAQMWNKVQWGAQYELDQAEAAAFAKARAEAGSGKGLNLGKGKRHWSSAAVHTNYYEPYPFPLEFIVVDHIYFSWDEMCDKFKALDKKIGDYGVGTLKGPPPASAAAALSTAAPAAQAAPSTTTPPQQKGGRGGGKKGA